MMDNNMPSRIDDYLDQVFGSYEDSPAVTELRIEVRHDLLERLSDLIERGIGDEVAYAQVISSVGDIGSTIQELAEQERVNQGTSSQPSDSETSSPADAGEETPAPTEEQKAPEPEGPAWAIPEGSAPGSDWTGDQSREENADSQGDSQTGFTASGRPNGRSDWVNDVAQIVTTSLDGILTQVTSALSQVESALETAGEGEGVAFLIRDKGKWAKWKGSQMSFSSSDLRGADFHGQQIPKSRFAASRLRDAILAGPCSRAVPSRPATCVVPTSAMRI